MISATAEYALRVLIEMTALPPGVTIPGRRLADSAHVPPNYLSKILWTLGSAGLIDATRGSGGGYRLQRAASSIHLCEVVGLFDRQRWMRKCFLGGGKECDEAHACAAHQAWREVRAAFLGFLENTTIKDLAPQLLPAGPLVKLTGLPKPGSGSQKRAKKGVGRK